MSESFAPAKESITQEAINRLKVVEEFNYTPSEVVDQRPTQEFRDATIEVIEARMRQPWTKTRVQLTEALDLYLARRGIKR